MYFSKTYWKSKACPEKTDQQKGSLELHDVIQAVKVKKNKLHEFIHFHQVLENAFYHFTSTKKQALVNDFTVFFASCVHCLRVSSPCPGPF